MKFSRSTASAPPKLIVNALIKSGRAARIVAEEREQAVKMQKKLRAMRMCNTGPRMTANVVSDEPASRRKNESWRREETQKGECGERWHKWNTDGRTQRRHLLSPSQARLQCPSHRSLLLTQTDTHLLSSSLSTSRAGDIFSFDMYPDPSTHVCLLNVAKARKGVTVQCFSPYHLQHTSRDLFT